MKICASCTFLNKNDKSVIIFSLPCTIFPKIHSLASLPPAFYTFHYIRKQCPPLFVNPQCFSLPPLDVKLGFMKFFFKVLDKEVAFSHLWNKIKNLIEAKVKGVFICPQIKAVFPNLFATERFPISFTYEAGVSHMNQSRKSLVAE